VLLGCACTSTAAPQERDEIDATAEVDASAESSPAPSHFCDLPGSVKFTTGGITVVPPRVTASDLSFLRVPAGFCFHYFGHVRNARQLRFAPGGELFVASPTTVTAGGDVTPDPQAVGAIVIMPDDDRDGTADTMLTFLSTGAPGSMHGSMQGMLFANEHFYYQTDGDDPAKNGTRIMRVPYTGGDRAPSGPSVKVADIDIYSSNLHWPKALEQATDGTIYVGNGGDQEETCDPARPFRGGILALDGAPGGTRVARGFRNPIAIRCRKDRNLCFAIELGLDGSYIEGGREKLVPIRNGDDWGYPCCFTQGVPSPMSEGADCSMVPPDDVSFYIGSTPFGLDFESGRWPAPYTGSVFVVLHGAVGNYAGARVVAIAVDPTTGMPLPGNDLSNMMSAGAMTDFATGWDDTTQQHGRPAAIAFAPDGRLFIANDNNGDIVWIAPLDLPRIGSAAP
jgi:glucose/arabinose dehydrogenase